MKRDSYSADNMSSNSSIAYSLEPMVSKVDVKTGECEDVSLAQNTFKIHSQVVMVSKMAWKAKIYKQEFEPYKQILIPMF